MSERIESDRFPYLPLHLEVHELVLELQALIDTGFDGDVIIPSSALRGGTPADYEVRARLADGSQVSLPGYLGEARVGQNDTFPIVLLLTGDEASVGRRVTDRFRVILDHGERVILEP